MRFIDRGTFQISWVEYIKLNVNIAILRIKSLNTEIVDRLYCNNLYESMNISDVDEKYDLYFVIKCSLSSISDYSIEL